jgi:hypothetical protein
MALRPACRDCSERWSPALANLGAHRQKASPIRNVAKHLAPAKPPQQRLGQLDLLKHHASLTARAAATISRTSGGKAEMLYTVRAFGISHSRADTYPALQLAPHPAGEKGAPPPRLETNLRNLHFDLLGSGGFALGDVQLKHTLVKLCVHLLGVRIVR